VCGCRASTKERIEEATGVSLKIPSAKEAKAGNHAGKVSYFHWLMTYIS
jgi:hypothetical protein